MTAGTFLPLPGRELPDPVYSNFDHQIDRAVVRELAARPAMVFAQHAALDYCGYVWLQADGRWVEQVWRHGDPVHEFEAESLEELFSAVLAECGNR